jgi:hypothetical protein
VGNRVGQAALEAAIDRLTRALVTAADEVIPELVEERRAMPEELEGLRRGENVVPFRAPRRSRLGNRSADRCATPTLNSWRRPAAGRDAATERG